MGAVAPLLFVLVATAAILVVGVLSETHGTAHVLQESMVGDVALAGMGGWVPDALLLVRWAAQQPVVHVDRLPSCMIVLAGSFFRYGRGLTPVAGLQHSKWVLPATRGRKTKPVRPGHALLTPDLVYFQGAVGTIVSWLAALKSWPQHTCAGQAWLGFQLAGCVV